MRGAACVARLLRGLRGNRRLRLLQRDRDHAVIDRSLQERFQRGFDIAHNLLGRAGRHGDNVNFANLIPFRGDRSGDDVLTPANHTFRLGHPGSR